MIRSRLRRPRGAGESEQADELIEIDPATLSGVFGAPGCTGSGLHYPAAHP